MLLVAVFMVSTSAFAAMPTDPIGGKPPVGSKVSVKDLDYQVKYQRAFEAVVWSVPNKSFIAAEAAVSRKAFSGHAAASNVRGNAARAANARLPFNTSLLLNCIFNLSSISRRSTACTGNRQLIPLHLP